MPKITAAEAGGENACAFLDMTAVSEMGYGLLAKSDDGYNVLVGSTATKPLLFKDYSVHPQIHNAAMNSDAAGRYQFMGRYWAFYRDKLALPDFGPLSQDRWALGLIAECGALVDIQAGRLTAAIAKCKSRWASFPGAGYGQRENSIQDMQRFYLAAGGKFANG
jgi:muramidase (phage lysozyme)